MYLKRQRDRLLEMKRKAREKELEYYKAAVMVSKPDKPEKALTITPYPVPSKEKKASPSKSEEGKPGAHASEKRQEKGKEGRNTGILCSAIAGKLRKQQAQS